MFRDFRWNGRITKSDSTARREKTGSSKRVILVGGKLKLEWVGSPGRKYLRGFWMRTKRDGRKTISTERDMSTVYVYQLGTMDVA